MKKRIKRLEQYISELRVVEPNDLGIPILTVVYRKINVFFKTAPFIFIIPLSLFFASLLVYLFGFVAVKLATLLQYGF
jgi:hypothetical protein